MLTILARLLIGLTVFFLCLSVSHAKVYIWIDSAGNKHFSDRPPEGEEKKNLTTRDFNQVKPVETGRDVTCGQNSIDLGSTNKEVYLLKLAKRHAHYIEQLQSRQSMANAGDYQCLTNWIENEIAANNGLVRSLQQEFEKKKLLLETATRERLTLCKDAAGWLVGKEAKEWYECAAKRDRLIARLKKRIAELLPLSNWPLNSSEK